MGTPRKVVKEQTDGFYMEYQRMVTTIMINNPNLIWLDDVSTEACPGHFLPYLPLFVNGRSLSRL